MHSVARPRLLVWLIAGWSIVGTACSGSSTETGAGGAGQTGGASGSGTGGSGTGGSGGSVASGGSAGTVAIAGSGGTGSGQGGSAGTGGGSGGGSCEPGCGESRDCCGGLCVNVQNDPKNCGACGAPCAAGTYCGGGQCVTPPCTATCNGGTECCGQECCSAGQLCCDPQGPVDSGPHCTEPSEQGTCPMGCAPLCNCASPETPISTPTGDKPIASLRAGDLVYSVDANAIKVVPLLRVHRTPVSHHQVQRVRLKNGVVLEISAGHPTADGRSFADLRPGTLLDSVAVTSAETIPYAHPYTYDILPASDSGAYFAGGVLVGSTLKGVDPRSLGGE